MFSKNKEDKRETPILNVSTCRLVLTFFAARFTGKGDVRDGASP